MAMGTCNALMQACIAAKSSFFLSVIQGENPMTTVSLVEAQAKLAELIHSLHFGEEVLIIENDQPIARILAAPPQPRKPRRPG